jgi:hypothetical protein
MTNYAEAYPFPVKLPFKGPSFFDIPRLFTLSNILKLFTSKPLFRGVFVKFPAKTHRPMRIIALRMKAC